MHFVCYTFICLFCVKDSVRFTRYKAVLTCADGQGSPLYMCDDGLCTCMRTEVRCTFFATEQICWDLVVAGVAEGQAGMTEQLDDITNPVSTFVWCSFQRQAN